MARGAQPEASRAIRAARHAGIPRREAEETALMLVLHAGFPAALEALGTLASRWPGRVRRLPEGGRSAWRRRGERLCRRVYGDSYDRLIENVGRLHPVMAAWMVEEGYGRVLSRPGLPAPARELVAVAVLASLGWERQLMSHLRGALRFGCPARDVARAVRIGTSGVGRERHAAAARALDRALEVAGLTGSPAGPRIRRIP